ncbi:MAG: ASCH domain-containing protein [Actinomycetota bacterium]|jgi:ASC-1-like (ASCH) protein|nr:ASCH domain-containing protein [Actinomycetota bacterium]|tara:strand:+ start:980 stop:1369 length:390 start_codon:yes stop_codon:yes gene_type:complete
MSIYPLEIYRKPLEAIISGRKKVEIRTNNSYENIDYTKLEPYDIIKFQIINGPPFVGLEIVEKDALSVEVLKVIKYKNPEDLLKNEGLEVLSGIVSSLEEGVEMLYSFEEYKEMIPIHGIFAIHFNLIS